MQPVDVFWHGQQDGRGYYNCTTFLNDIFDYYGCIHHAGWDGIPKQIEHAIVVVHGGRELGRLDTLNEHIEHLESVFLIFLGDEEGSFPVEFVQHPNKVVWVQEPIPGRHDSADRYLIDGYTPGTKSFLAEDGPFSNGRDLDWVFAGQVTHERRRACVDALRTINWGGVIVESKGYCQGVSIEEYHRLLTRAKIVPCPSGPHAPDAARPWEALECGAIPILDAYSPTMQPDDYWTYVLGPHPLPVIKDWENLPQMIEELKQDWETKSAVIQQWWASYKMKMFNAMALDLGKLGEGK